MSVLLQCIEDRLGNIIHGKLDSLNRDIIFTDSFVARQTSRIRGVFSAITRQVDDISLCIREMHKLDDCIGGCISQYIRLLYCRDASLNTLHHCIRRMHLSIH